MNEKVVASQGPRAQGFDLAADANDSSLALDALRAVAAQMVCVGHACNLLLERSTTYLPHVGVLLFFVLSGFVIAHTLERKAKDPAYGLPAFVVERGARIYSAYLPALALIAILDIGLAALGSPPEDGGWGIWWRNLLMLQNYAGWWMRGVPTYGSAGQLSSVAAEWHIYVFVGALYFLLRGRNRLLCLVIAVLAAAQPLAYFRPLPDSDRALFVLWLLGFGCYYIARATRIDAWTARVALAVLPMLIVLWLRKRVPGAEYALDHYPLLALAMLALVLGTQRSRAMVVRAWVVRGVSAMAGFAFSLFLLHFTIQKLLGAWWPQRGVAAVLVAVLVSNVLAWAFAQLTEIHYRRVGKWLLGLKPRVMRQWRGGVPAEETR